MFSSHFSSFINKISDFPTTLKEQLEGKTIIKLYLGFYK